MLSVCFVESASSVLFKWKNAFHYQITAKLDKGESNDACLEWFYLVKVKFIWHLEESMYILPQKYCFSEIALYAKPTNNLLLGHLVHVMWMYLTTSPEPIQIFSIRTCACMGARLIRL